MQGDHFSRCDVEVHPVNGTYLLSCSAVVPDDPLELEHAPQLLAAESPMWAAHALAERRGTTGASSGASSSPRKLPFANESALSAPARPAVSVALANTAMP